MKKTSEQASKKSPLMRFWISPLFFVMAAVLLYFGYGFELCGYLVTLVVHEFAHAQAAKKLGYRLHGMKLMPYGASLSGEFDSARPRDEILIAIAGPAVNLIMAVATVAVWWLAPVSYMYTEAFFYDNLFTALFNFLPLYPLDGGRILLAALSSRYKRQSVYKILRITGLFAAFGFAALFFMTFWSAANISFASVAVFFFLSTIIPDKHSVYGRLYAMSYRTEKLKKGLAVREVLVSADTQLLALFKMLSGNYFYRFCVVDHNFKMLGTVTELELETLSAKYSPNLPIGKIMKTLEQ